MNEKKEKEGEQKRRFFVDQEDIGGAPGCKDVGGEWFPKRKKCLVEVKKPTEEEDGEIRVIDPE